MRPLIALLLLFLWPASAMAEVRPSPCMPFIGEQMDFSVGWEFINAGYATMQVTGNATGWQVETRARTNRFLDMFKKVRDTITARGICIGDRMQSTVFDIEQHENRYHAVKKTRFLWKRHRATFTQNGKTDSYRVPAGHLSVIDAFFLVRAMKLEAGKTLTIPIFDSRKRYELEVRVSKRRKKFKAPWGGFVDCIEVEPKLKTEGIFSSKGKIKIWMTDDDRHIPLKMTAKIKIGHIVAILNDYRNGRI